MSEKAVVLLSAGLDSFVNFALAIKHGLETKLAITINYGQVAAEKEVDFSKKIANHYGVKHLVIDINNVMSGISFGLNNNKTIPSFENTHLNDYDYCLKTAKAVWVPNRNSLMLAIAATHAEFLDCKYVITGYNFEEAQTFPDNSLQFMEAISKAFSYSTANKVIVKSFTIDMNKQQILKEGKRLSIPFEYLWSCYNNNDMMCGRCESCQRLIRALSTYPELIKKVNIVTGSK